MRSTQSGRASQQAQQWGRKGDRGGHQEDMKCGNNQYRYIVDLCHKITNAEFRTFYERFGASWGHDLIHNSEPGETE